MGITQYTGRAIASMRHRPTGVNVFVGEMPEDGRSNVRLRRRARLLLRLAVQRANTYGPPRLVRDYTEASGAVFDGAIPIEVRP